MDCRVKPGNDERKLDCFVASAPRNDASNHGCHMIFRVLPILLASLTGASWTDTETVNVEGRGVVDLAPLACQDITRSTLVNRVCYDAAKRVMIVEVNAAYSGYCGVPETTLHAFLNAPSMGQYYNANIKDSVSGPYHCPAKRAPKT
jgi:hypothetical protein